MANESSAPTDFAEAVNRACNLLVTAILGITALAFGSDLFVEADMVDKVDNTLLLVLGVVAVVWYFTGRHWAKRSSMPVILAALALVVQIAGFVIEIGDPTALGDDIPGLLVFGSGLVIVAAVYYLNGRYLALVPSSREAAPPGGRTPGS